MAKPLPTLFIWVINMPRTKIINPNSEVRNPRPSRFRSASALILAIVLTSLLAIVGVVFLLSSRVDSIATSAITDNKDLDLAVDTAIAHVSEALSLDVPYTDINGVVREEYYDYPDNLNRWLASLEPNVSGLWPHITDLKNQLGALAYNLSPAIISDYQSPAAVGDSNTTNGRYAADADGDGVSDSAWVELPGVSSSKGKPIYAAIRVIDNSAMLNVNTGYRFDPCDPVRQNIDGSSQMQINLMALAARPPLSYYTIAEANELVWARANYGIGLTPGDFSAYAQNVLWQYGQPVGPYTPFDISDELEMRNRFVLNHVPTSSRLEDWGGEFRKAVESTPYDSVSEWFKSAYDTGVVDQNYAYRHVATTYNLDRIINPEGGKMFNINTADSANINAVMLEILSRTIGGDVNGISAQMTANLIDYRDMDDDVTVIYDDVNNGYFGFETPCVYLSEVAYSFVSYDANASAARSYALELFKPYWEDSYPSIDPNTNWQIRITPRLVGPVVTIPVIWSGSPRFHVIEFVDANTPDVFDVNFSDVSGPNDVNEPNNPRTTQNSPLLKFEGGEFIELQRRIPSIDNYLTVDWVWVPEYNDITGWLVVVDSNSTTEYVRSYQRDIGQAINPHKCIRGKPVIPGVGLWSADFGVFPAASIGGPNPWTSNPPEPYIAPYVIQAHPANAPFTNVGEIGRLFITSAYDINYVDTELRVRLNLQFPEFQPLFNYLTVIDPYEHGQLINETKIKGRININTAPWFVLAQLPWVSAKIGEPLDYRLAQTITAYRDKIISPTGVNFRARLGSPGFQNIGQLNLANDPNIPIAGIDYYARDANDLLTYPDLTSADGAISDFEERDVIFSRISDLVTVRSDVFTAYILVRVGRDGPQKRAIAILDRSGVSSTPAGYTGKVKIRAIHPVPDPR